MQTTNRCQVKRKRPRGFPAGAIPTVDFLLHDFGRFVKKTCVKTLVEAAELSGQQDVPPNENPADLIFREPDRRHRHRPENLSRTISARTRESGSVPR